jgi:beta-ureidopropionase / N-carbamoyl-L-amino-acid hydrolase
MTRADFPVDGKRLWDDVMALGTITDPQRPYTRRSFSPLFIEGRAWLARRFTDAGLKVRVDFGGNLIGRMEGTDPPAYSPRLKWRARSQRSRATRSK